MRCLLLEHTHKKAIGETIAAAALYHKEKIKSETHRMAAQLNGFICKSDKSD
jgi:hypothetical protein